ncbi:hypothetical protein Scep_005203 [Stephania cephalantha]|uniref:Uncharacterized protein n=1 Tax=Stephania cephalantha TaxID=152367 RepID=A0AAP0KVG9_9MAGN
MMTLLMRHVPSNLYIFFSSDQIFSVFAMYLLCISSQARLVVPVVGVVIPVVGVVVPALRLRLMSHLSVRVLGICSMVYCCKIYV